MSSLRSEISDHICRSLTKHTGKTQEFIRVLAPDRSLKFFKLLSDVRTTSVSELSDTFTFIIREGERVFGFITNKFPARSAFGTFSGGATTVVPALEQQALSSACEQLLRVRLDFANDANYFPLSLDEMDSLRKKMAMEFFRQFGFMSNCERSRFYVGLVKHPGELRKFKSELRSNPRCCRL